LPSPDEWLAVCRGDAKCSNTWWWVTIYFNAAGESKSIDENSTALYLLYERFKRTAINLSYIYIITTQSTCKHLEIRKMVLSHNRAVNDFPHLLEDLKTLPFVGFSISLPVIIIDNSVHFNYHN
jgi:hypothetical protein